MLLSKYKLYSRRQRTFDQRRMEQNQMPQADLLEQLARREQQLEQLRNAYVDLQQRQQVQPNQINQLYKNVAHLPTFTGNGEITINSFLSNVEYLLSTIDDEELRKEAVKAIYYRNIQGEAKNTIINIQEPNNWPLIKKTLKLRYRPDTEPHQLYRRINNINVNTVSQLAIEIQNIKYKSDELIIYHSGEHCIDLTNIDSILVNTIKEMTQGTLLDKIYDERDLGNILEIMTRRRFEDSCIRPEFRRYGNRTTRYNNTNQNRNNSNQQMNYNNNNFNRGYNQQNNVRQNFRQNYNPNNNINKNFNNLGQYRAQDNRNNNTNMSGNFQRPQTGNPRQNSGQYRQNPFRQGQVEPMEIDNIESNMSGFQLAGHPSRQISQNRLIPDRQSQEETQPKYNREKEVNNCIFFMKRPQNDYVKGKENRVADFLSRIENINRDKKLLTNNQEDTENKSKFNTINNIEDDNISMATAHSAEENLQDHFYIKEEIVNKYKTQIVLTNNKTEELKILHGKRIVFIAENDFGILDEIFKKYVSKGKIGIFSELSDHNYNIVQEKLIELFSNDKQIEFIKCTMRAQDIETEVEAIKQISLYHVRESAHSGIIETYNQIKNKIYYPGLMQLIQLVINQCEICQEIKYDRKPIKLKFSHTETPSKINEIIHIDTYIVKRFHFLTVIDKFSKFGAAYPLNDRNHVTIIEQLDDHFAKIGKPRKIIADNEFKGVRIKEFLDNENIELHLTKPNSHTGNADIERFHNTIAEKFRILYNTNKETPVKQLIQRSIRNYNERYHSTIKCIPSIVQQGKIDENKIKKTLEDNKRKIIDKLNNSREDYTENRTEGFIKNYKAVRHKEQPKYRKAKLEQIHPSNIKRKLKFSDLDNTDDINRDTTD